MSNLRNYRPASLVTRVASPLLVLVFGVLLCTPCVARTYYEASYLYVNRYPDQGTPNWGDDETITSGITHDDNNWYVSANGTTTVGFPNDDWIIWRIPVSEPLDQDFTGSSNPGVKYVRRTGPHGVPTLDALAFRHAGDLDHAKHTNQAGQTKDYLFVPMTGPAGAAVAVFDAANLSFVNYELLAQRDVGWCAVSPDGHKLYSSNDELTPDNALLRYTIDWDKLLGETENHDALTSGGVDNLTLRDRANQDYTLLDMQGGEFSPKGELLYLSSGKLYLSVGATDGIHVFDTSSWREIERSINPERGQRGYFNYSFDNSFTGGDEPEGLTVWDVGTRAPFVRGQLHALVYSHNYNPLNSNTVTLMHYESNLSVSKCEGSSPAWTLPLPGTPSGAPVNGRPFESVNAALDWYDVWDGARMRVQAGEYSGPVTLPTRVSISSQGGVATLGLHSESHVRLYEHPNYQGTWRDFTCDVPDLDLGTINFADVASSVRLFGAREVKLYDGNGYGGSSIDVTDDIPDLTPLGWNDRVGSVRILFPATP